MDVGVVVLHGVGEPTATSGVDSEENEGRSQKGVELATRGG